MQSIGELFNDFLALFFFIFLSLLVSGVVKLKGERKEKFDKVMERRGTLFKLLTYIGTFAIATLVIIQIFKLSNHKKAAYISKRMLHQQWTNTDKEKMTEDCIKEATRGNAMDTSKIRALCECMVEKVTKKYTYIEAEAMDKIPEEERMKALQPIFKRCKTEMDSSIIKSRIKE